VTTTPTTSAQQALLDDIRKYLLNKDAQKETESRPTNKQKQSKKKKAI
jgi:hypothetical protein